MQFACTETGVEISWPLWECFEVGPCGSHYERLGHHYGRFPRESKHGRLGFFLFDIDILFILPSHCIVKQHKDPYQRLGGANAGGVELLSPSTRKQI